MATDECTRLRELDDDELHCSDCDNKACRDGHHHCGDCGYYYEDRDLYELSDGFLYTCRWCSPELSDNEYLSRFKEYLRTGDHSIIAMYDHDRKPRREGC